METELYQSNLQPEDWLGEGAHGTVYKCYKKDEEKTLVALKQIKNDNHISTDSAKKDLTALQAVSGHKNIVRLLDFHTDKHFIYIIMEFCHGDLEQYLSKGIPSYRVKLEIMKQCARGVNYIHSLEPPVVHRDIKTQNILLQELQSGIRIKIGDFGMAKVFSKIGISVYNMYMTTNVGTMGFRAPELWKNIYELQYTAKIDNYSLGLLFAILLNYGEDEKLLEPYIADIPREPYLPLGMGQLHNYNSNKPLPRLYFTPSVEGNHPRMKSLIEEMIHFDAKERMEIQTVKAAIKSEILQLNEEETRRKCEVEFTAQIVALKAKHDQDIAALKLSHDTEYENLQKDYEQMIETQIEESRQPASAVSPSTSSQHPYLFRKTDTNLMNIKALTPIPNRSFRIKNKCYRMCYNNNMLLFPHNIHNTMSCYTTEGQFVKVIHLHKYNISFPRSVHPLTGETVLLAASNGLYVLSTGEVDLYKRIRRGDIIDVHVCKAVLAIMVDEHSLFGTDFNVYLYDTSDLSTVKSTFKLEYKTHRFLQYLYTMLISNDVVYISSCNDHNIKGYNINKGILSSQYGRAGSAPGELHSPRLSACDTEGSLLVMDCNNDRMQTCTAQGEWSVLPQLVDVQFPQDAVVIGDLLYTLNGSVFDLIPKNKINVFKITYT